MIRRSLSSEAPGQQQQPGAQQSGEQLGECAARKAHCRHCGEPIYDNGTVYVHRRRNGEYLIESQWCDEAGKRTIAEASYHSAPCPTCAEARAYGRKNFDAALGFQDRAMRAESERDSLRAELAATHENATGALKLAERFQERALTAERLTEQLRERLERERGELLAEARDARAAIRHALQFLEDPEHHGDGHLLECIASCRNVLKTDGKYSQDASVEQKR